MPEIKLISHPDDLSVDCDSRDYARRYMAPFMTGESQNIIANVQTRAAFLDTGDMVFPVTINETEYDNCYVCSPYTACVSYAQEEMGKLRNRFLEQVLGASSRGMGVLLKRIAINQVVSINNWMLSTNLYPVWDGSNIGLIRDFLLQRFPAHTLMFRSLNKHSNAGLIRAFKKAGFMLVPSRQVYIFDRNLADYTKKHNVEIDLKMLQKTAYRIVKHVEITPADYPRIVDLYNVLYLDKYSYHNPRFTIACVANWHKNNLLVMHGLRNEQGILDGVIGCFERNGITSIPLVGYDTKLPKHFALYRMLMALGMRRALNENLVLNLSSGASEFKRMRGGQPFIEYSAVYIRHLSWLRRFVWRLTNGFLTYLGIPIMKVFKL